MPEQTQSHDAAGSTGARIGLVAGWGQFPVVVAKSLKAAGCEVHCAGIMEHADPALREICDTFLPIRLARGAAMIRYFHQHGVKQATLAGKIFKDKLLYGRFGWVSLMPDFYTLRMFFPHFILKRKNRNDDTLLHVVVQTFARKGITMAPATDFAPQLLARPGQLTKRAPSASQWRDIEFAWKLAKEMGRLDVGQSVAVKGQAVLAVEAMEGTDECIRRAGKLCKHGEFTVVKVAKPQQDMRFDVPTIGVGTIESLVASQARVLAIEAGKTILLDEAAVIDLANRHGLAIVSIDQPPAS